MYYFGVGEGSRMFEDLVKERGDFTIGVCKEYEQGNVDRLEPRCITLWVEGTRMFVDLGKERGDFASGGCKEYKQGNVT